MGTNPYHLPVLVSEILGYFRGLERGTIIDGTVGGGGHAEAILSAFPGINVIGLDKDPEALQASRDRLSGFGERVKLALAGFETIPEQMTLAGEDSLSGVLLDLGISSRQINSGSRGFSFMNSGDLDMRFGPQCPVTAEHIINTYPEEKLADLFYHYGEERNSRRIARAVVAARQEKRITTTTELARIVEQNGGGHVKSRARIFQALRIEVNQELAALTSVLDAVPSRLRPGGRFAVIAYHSLEDRLVKSAFRLGSNGLKRLHKKVIRPSEEEVRINPRSRSALLRVAEKI